MTYVFHAPLMRDLQELIELDRFPHALMIDADEGMGLEDFAKLLAKKLLCKTAQACQDCASCHWFEVGSHPDYKALGLEGNIAIDEVRELIEFTHLKPEGRCKVVLLAADKLSVASNHALLKCLEEPVTRVCFILMTHRASQIMPTILSRCVKRSLIGIQADTPRFDLKHEEGIKDDLMALFKKTANPVQLGEKWSKTLPLETLYLLYRWIAQSLGSKGESLGELSGFLASLSKNQMFLWTDSWHKAVHHLKQPGAKASMIITSMLIDWQKAVRE